MDRKESGQSFRFPDFSGYALSLLPFNLMLTSRDGSKMDQVESGEKRWRRRGWKRSVELGETWKWIHSGVETS